MRRQKGFTIIELLVATMVFSLILVVLTLGVVSFTKSYYRGVTASATQNVARTTMDNITQEVQFSGQDWRPLLDSTKDKTGTNSGIPSQGFCVGSTRYSYLPGWQLEEGADATANTGLHQNQYAFVRDTPSGGCFDNQSKVAQDLANWKKNAVMGTELLSPHMRVAKASLQKAGTDPNLFLLNLRIVYGDDDLLLNPTAPDAKCKDATAGTQFCATSEMSTTIQRRVN